MNDKAKELLNDLVRLNVPAQDVEDTRGTRPYYRTLHQRTERGEAWRKTYNSRQICANHP